VSILGVFFVTSLLREAGWPRKQGIFGGETYDTLIVDSVIDQMVDWGAALGAGRPRAALQVLSEMYRDKDWEGDNPPNVMMFVDSMQSTWSAAQSPREAVTPIRFAKAFGRSMPPDAFNDARAQVALEQQLLEAIFWGLSNPKRFEAWYESYAAKRGSSLPTMQKAGLDVGSASPLSQFFEDRELILREYERAVGPLPPIPARLISDARALGWIVD
jgi:hypothetical protein